jgi:hypothetical protein
MQVDQLDQVPLLHVRDWVPVHAQGWELAPAQEHCPHVQLPLHVCEPPAVPQLCVAFGAHGPCAMHADHADHCPVLPLHVRVCVPQLPHACEAGPLQV